MGLLWGTPRGPEGYIKITRGFWGFTCKDCIDKGYIGVVLRNSHPIEVDPPPRNSPWGLGFGVYKYKNGGP